MAQHPWLDPKPFSFEGGSVGALLIHGFTGAPTEMRPLGEVLAAEGYTVNGPLLPGHGTTPQDLADRKWHEWATAVETAYTELAASCDQVFAVGLSLGTLLALNLAADQAVSGLVLVSPAIFFANPMMRFSWLANWFPINARQESLALDMIDPEADGRTWCYEIIPGRAAHQVNLLNRRVRKLLPSIHAPTLAVMSRGDKSLKFESGPHVIKHIASDDKALVTLHNSGHNIMVDAERENVYQMVAEFIGERAANR